ncbi:DNA primase [Rhodobacter capsulatus]|uniref:DNA primase n=2 Tax=Rhodobacter capsulatus TaxID=1061 RepID=D5AQJ0_RHOCB|nr:DNA primase [Rhodobacter capsulatus]ADE86779.1 DNA primase [Rhodobacter capsulatus SB 1003]ETD00332.1 DNA primase [Rhodobacter capsulatus DE442]ETD74673.1 DNA primase [Rhodobacter capsulatus R121]ETE52536.1 DNA primase [Rhodobacter capsulatus Y262]MDS0928579.1 DNA primase [Rhodobacter capsulatus]
MSLPPGFLDELRNRLPLSQVVGRKVIWDPRKSNRAKGDFWAPCPFHTEKSASFHVDDRKGFYYCFGCHAKGDAVSFVKETENVGFVEAVEILAREAGMVMPARDPQAAQKADRRTELVRVMEEAVKYFRLQLNTQAGAAARDYLARRRLGASALERFEIGFAPDSRNGLFQALTGKGIAPDLIVDAGLCIRPDEGGTPYDRFRGRIIFPIRDARGRAISLGGRAMDPNARAKYLNGPETELFDKGRNLYNLGPAREACGKGKPLIVAEGYVDVIALVEAGFTGAVAPLGTAITEDQLKLMWRIADEPVIALDGDAAGLRAGLRLVDLALPLLEAGKALRFAILPGGQDPDDLIKAEGREAMERVLASAKPMVDLLWQRETEGKVFDSPERKAALDKSLRAALKKIADPSIRTHYGEDIKRLREELFGLSRGGQAPRWTMPQGAFSPGPRGPGAGGRGAKPQALPLSATRASLLASAGSEAVAEQLRETMIVAILCAHPVLVAEFESQIERLRLSDPGLGALRDTMLMQADRPAGALAEALARENPGVLETLMRHPHVRSAPPVLRRDDSDFARMCLAEELAKLQATRAVRAETEEAAEALEGLADEGVTWRISQATKAFHRAGKSKLEDTGDLGEDRAAMSDFLQSLLDKHGGG